MIKPLLNFVGKFVPGVNILATGYTIKQVIAVGIGAYQTYNGSIPVVNQPFSETIIKTVLQTAMSSGVGVGLHTVFRKSKINNRLEALEKGVSDEITRIDNRIVDVEKQIVEKIDF